MKTATGVVKWFSNAKGYGFIMPDEGGEEIFAHFSAIEMEGYRTLKQGQKVEFQIQQGPKGWMAACIRPTGGSAAAGTTAAGGSAAAASVSVVQE